MISIIRTSKLPLYQQIHDLLRGEILSGGLKPGDMLLPESELALQHKVSTITVRQALELLEEEGLIYRQRGRGTFVAHPTLEQGLVRIVSFTEDMQQRGFRAGTQVLATEVVPAVGEAVSRLQVAEGEPLARVARLRLADGEPLSLEESFLLMRHCPGILQHDYATQSLRQALEREFGIRLTRASQTIRAVEAQGETARWLSVKPRAALLLIERVSYSQLEMPVEFLRIYYRGDRYVLYNELQG